MKSFTSGRELNSSCQQHMRGLQTDAKPDEVTERMDIHEQKRTRWHTARLKRMSGEDSAAETEPVAVARETRSIGRVPCGNHPNRKRRSFKSIRTIGPSEIGGMFEQRQQLQPTGIASLNRTSGWTVGSGRHFAAAR